MSTVYTLEPPTAGKVVLVTSAGDVELELWSKEAPKACRNFVQLCLEGYYNDVIFHRVIKGFMIQTGDPTGTGTGGESVYGEDFKDEFHSRLSFNHRGQLAMANSGRPNTNSSQFFITLDKSPWLDKKHTIFGKVAGTTIYNCIKMGELECIEGTDRPAEPARILRCDVVWNPFEDIVPRNLRPRDADVVLVDNAAEAGVKKRKNLALLSFGDDAEEEEEEAPPAKRGGKSIHDVVEDDARLVKAGTADEEAVKAQLEEEWEREQAARAVRSKLAGPSGEEKAAGEPDDGDFEARMRRQILDKRSALASALPPPPPLPLPPPPPQAADTDDTAAKEARRREKEARLEAKRVAEADKLRRLGLTKLAADKGLYNPGELKRREIKLRKEGIAEREKETLAKLQRFQQGLSAPMPPRAPDAAPDAAGGEREGGTEVTRFRSEGLYYDDDGDDGDWRTHALHFVKPVGDTKSFAPSVDDYVVLDPLLEKGKEAFMKSKLAKRSTEWSKGTATHK